MIPITQEELKIIRSIPSFDCVLCSQYRDGFITSNNKIICKQCVAEIKELINE